VDNREEPMNKYDTVDEHLMELELNNKVFRSDPLKKISDEDSRVDRFNKKYLIELKCRKYSIDKIKLWGGAMIERDKYRALISECGDKIPAYINKFPCGSYYGWNLKKIKEPSWYEEDLPKSTVEDKGLRPKIVGDLQFEDGKKLI
tara:strand:- start:221 stop:658 length:438 start_codon:yes stop_codon:yes gene_type:complete